jgi:hypothetical protein
MEDLALKNPMQNIPNVLMLTCCLEPYSKGTSVSVWLEQFKLYCELQAINEDRKVCLLLSTSTMYTELHTASLPALPKAMSYIPSVSPARY